MRGLVEGVPFGGLVYDVAADVIARYRQQNRLRQLSSDLEQVIQAEARDLRIEIAEVAEQAAAGKAEVARQIESYLLQVPAVVQRSLRRPEDPRGTTVPAAAKLDDPAQLAALLPQRLPRFRAGQTVPSASGWVLDRLLGAGGFGEVWLASHPALRGQLRAFNFCLDREARERLLRHEGQVIQRVMRASRAVTADQQGIVPLLDAHLDGETPWLAYEYIDGGDLAGLVKASQARDPAARGRAAFKLLQRLATIVGELHRLPEPVIHRDLKPANVLVKRVGKGFVLRVTDFGIGHIAADQAIRHATISTPQASLGETLRGAHSPIYASPQQKRGHQPDVRDDVHALGVIGFQLLLADLQAERPSGVSWRRKVAACGLPDPVLDLLGRCWEDDPADRPADAKALADELAAATAPPPVTARTAGGPTAPHVDEVDELAEEAFRDDERRRASARRRTRKATPGLAGRVMVLVAGVAGIAGMLFAGSVLLKDDRTAAAPTTRAPEPEPKKSGGGSPVQVKVFPTPEELRDGLAAFFGDCTMEVPRGNDPPLIGPFRGTVTATDGASRVEGWVTNSRFHAKLVFHVGGDGRIDDGRVRSMTIDHAGWTEESLRSDWKNDRANPPVVMATLNGSISLTSAGTVAAPVVSLTYSEVGIAPQVVRFSRPPTAPTRLPFGPGQPLAGRATYQWANARFPADVTLEAGPVRGKTVTPVTGTFRGKHYDTTLSGELNGDQLGLIGRVTRWGAGITLPIGLEYRLNGRVKFDASGWAAGSYDLVHADDKGVLTTTTLHLDPTTLSPSPPARGRGERRYPAGELAAGKVRVPDLSAARLVCTDDFNRPADAVKGDRYHGNGRLVIKGGGTLWNHAGPVPADDFAVELRCMSVGAPTARGGLVVANMIGGKNRAVQFLFSPAGILHVEPWEYDTVGGGPAPRAYPSRDTRPEAVQTLTLIVRRQPAGAALVEVYVNGAAVDNPITVTGAFADRLILQSLRGTPASRAEFDRLRVWSLGAVRTPFQAEE